LLVESLDRLLGDRAVRVVHEGEAARTARFTVDGENDRRRRADARQVLAKVRLGCGIRQVPDEQSN
jgi:hypothetical protein